MKLLRRLAPYLLLTAVWALCFRRFAVPEPAGDFSQRCGDFRGIA